MDLNINIVTSDSCKVLIQDTTKYIPENTINYGKYEFKYSDTVSIDVLQLNKLNENIVKDFIITTHDIKQDNYITVPIKFDGWFSVQHIVLPSKEWFLKELNKQEGSLLGMYSIVYYADETTIYKYIDDVSYAVPLDEILEINPINTTILKIQQEYISICFLRKCYINLCKQIFNNRGFSQCKNKNNIDSELVYKRDLVWMTINVIKYLTENNQLSEVERMIENIKGCNGLCNDTNITSNANGCGCS